METEHLTALIQQTRTRTRSETSNQRQTRHRSAGRPPSAPITFSCSLPDPRQGGKIHLAGAIRRVMTNRVARVSHKALPAS